jgi:hypothetical protein
VGAGLIGLYIVMQIFRTDTVDIRETIPESQLAVHTITEPARTQFFYGTLNALPHTYRFTLASSTQFDVALYAPRAGAGEMGMISGILVKEPLGKGRVTEIARLRAADATWEVQYDARIGVPMRAGSEFSQTLESGTYRFEVHTPDNVEPYVLRVGIDDERTMGYVTFVRELAALREFLGASAFTLPFSPFIHVPLLVLVLLGYALLLWYYRVKRV